MTTPLETGSALPPILGRDADGDEVDLVASVAGTWAVIQLYRGHW
ncbi:MAG: hypothetical protein AAGA17_17230 [Actinomycetota bacterium]